MNEQRSKNVLIQTESTVEPLASEGKVSERQMSPAKGSALLHTPPAKMLKIRSDGKLASPKAPMEQLETQETEVPRDHNPPQNRSTKFVKRNFKISANGTLDSVYAEAMTDAPKRRGRKQKSEIERTTKPTYMVVVKYRIADGNEANIGRQVDEILSGKRFKAQMQPARVSEPPKSTHPFFTGELSRKSQLESAPVDDHQAHVTDQQGSKSQQVMTHKSYSGPKESRITSKPPGAGRQLDDTHEGAFPTFGTDHAKVTRFPGATEPPWPPFDMVHVGYSPADGENTSVASPTLGRGRKLKDAQIQILPNENILNESFGIIDLHDSDDKQVPVMPNLRQRSNRQPCRRIMTGTQLQQTIRSRVSLSVSNELDNDDLFRDELSNSQPSTEPSHKSLLYLMQRLPHSRSAFDNFRCETEEWAHKYAPKCAEHLLQQGTEAEVLRDWLKALTVSSVGGGGGECQTRDSSVTSKRKKVRKKRKTGELDNFVVSGDDEPNEMIEIADNQGSGLLDSPDKKSVMRTGAARDGERTANAVVISGPHGCGKTAAVFAVAKELDFEVFEVNASSRRSGKDVLDKVGDMTRNHLVQHRPELAATDCVDTSADLAQLDEKLQADLSSGRQGTMQSFFKVQAEDKMSTPQTNDRVSKAIPKKGRPKKNIIQEVLSKPRDQKQSLILLEEVDILFEEDKLFWATVLDLLVRSKRPVIMTCSDESLVPLDDMALHAILRFAPAPINLATDYLLLVAASEGHLLSRDSVQSLYKAKSSDLRASLTELNFYCQMGVGDSKGGLEWMLLDKSKHTSDNAEPPRVISEDTYLNGMGWLGSEDVSSHTYESLDELIEISADVWDGWHVDLGDTTLLGPVMAAQSRSKSREELQHSLRNLDHACEAFSAADILPASVVRQELFVKIDTDHPELNDQTRYSYIEGSVLLQPEPLVDHSGTSDALALALRASAAKTDERTESFSISVQQVIGEIALARSSSDQFKMSLLKLMSTFQPIADDTPSANPFSKNMSTSSFDGPISTIVQDVAPYIRGIVSYDLRLEEQRRQLSNLLTQPGLGNKKTRTTRASRAALEGGNKADTRRERWFPKQTNFSSVLETGGKEWQQVALQMSLEHYENQNVSSAGSRESSIISRDGPDIYSH